MNRLCILALLVLSLAPAARAQDFVKWLPEKTLAYVSIEDCARLRGRLEKSALTAIWKDPAMKAMRALIEKEFSDAEDGKASQREFFDLLEGQVCFASIPISTTKETEVLLLDLKGKQRELLDLIQRLDDEQDGELRKEEEDFHGYTLTTHRRLVEGAEEPEVDYRIQKDDLYAMAQDVDVLKDIITRREAADNTGLAAWEPHKKVLAATAQRADVRWYVSSSLWLREAGAMAAPFLAAFGLDGIKAVGGQVSLAERGIQTQIVLQNEGEPRALMRLLGSNIENLGPSPLLPPDVDPAFTIALDWQFLYTESLRILGMFDPGSVAEAKGVIGEFEQGLGIKLHDDLLGAMAPGLTYALLPIPEAELAKAPKGDGFPEFAAEFAVVLQKLRNAEKMNTLLAKLVAEEGSPYKEVAYLGTKTYETEIEGLPAFAVIDGHLVLAPRPDSLRALIQRQGKELKGFRDTDAYKRGLELVPGKRSVLMVTNPAASSMGASPNWLSFWDAMRAANPLGAAFADAAPPMDFLEKFQDVSALSFSTETQGLVVNWFWGLKPPEGSGGAKDE